MPGRGRTWLPFSACANPPPAWPSAATLRPLAQTATLRPEAGARYAEGTVTHELNPRMFWSGPVHTFVQTSRI